MEQRILRDMERLSYEFIPVELWKSKLFGNALSKCIVKLVLELVKRHNYDAHETVVHAANILSTYRVAIAWLFHPHSVS